MKKRRKKGKSEKECEVASEKKKKRVERDFLEPQPRARVFNYEKGSVCVFL